MGDEIVEQQTLNLGEAMNQFKQLMKNNYSVLRRKSSINITFVAFLKLSVDPS